MKELISGKKSVTRGQLFFSMVYVAVLFQCAKDSMINPNTLSPIALSTLFVFTNRIYWGAILTK